VDNYRPPTPQAPAWLADVLSRFFTAGRGLGCAIFDLIAFVLQDQLLALFAPDLSTG
jgi:hypothetical protein